MQTTLDIVEGMQFDRGYLSPYFVTDAEKMKLTLKSRTYFLTKKDQQYERSLTCA